MSAHAFGMCNNKIYSLFYEMSFLFRFLKSFFSVEFANFTVQKSEKIKCVWICISLRTNGSITSNFIIICDENSLTIYCSEKRTNGCYQVFVLISKSDLCCLQGQKQRGFTYIAFFVFELWMHNYFDKKEQFDYYFYFVLFSKSKR